MHSPVRLSARTDIQRPLSHFLSFSPYKSRLCGATSIFQTSARAPRSPHSPWRASWYVLPSFLTAQCPFTTNDHAACPERHIDLPADCYGQPHDSINLHSPRIAQLAHRESAFLYLPRRARLPCCCNPALDQRTREVQHRYVGR